MCRKMRRSAAIAIPILIACGIVAAEYHLQVFIIRNAKSEQLIFLRMVKPGNTFLLKYLHSVELSDVWDRFVIDADHEFVLTETRFQGQGAGLPTSLSGNEKLIREGDWFTITGMNRRVPLIYWRVQPEWNNRFLYGNEAELNLSQQLGDALVLIEVQEMKVVTWLYYHLSAAIQYS